MRLRSLVLLFCLTVPAVISGCAGETAAEHTANVYAAQELAAAPAHGNLPDYSLPPDQLTKAQHLETMRTSITFGRTAWAILQFVLLLGLGVVAWIRDRALAAGAWLHGRDNRLGQLCLEWLVFGVLFTTVTEILDLPLSLFNHHLALEYGLSIQRWGDWFGDWGKSFGLTLIGSLLFFALLMWLIRSLPRAWWIVCWTVVTPVILFATYLTPLVIDPLYNTFEPLSQSHPELVAQLERVVAKGNMNIPPERMFLMKASAKTTTINAYVTGFGGSKRVVVWDTSLQKGTPDQVLFIFGHESGHYVLGHVLRGIVMSTGGLLFAFFLGYHFIRWSIRRFGTSWRIPGQGDWAALAVLLFAFTLLLALSEPLVNAISRSEEHAADVYGQEAIHGLVANPQETTRSAFDTLGASSLEQPNPNLFVEFWSENHPATGRRAAFGHVYDPWAAGVTPKYFPRE